MPPRSAPDAGPARPAGPAWRGRIRRDHLAVLAGLAVPLVLTVCLVPARSSLPNTDAALALILVVVAAIGHRLAGVLAAVSAAVWFATRWRSPQLKHVHWRGSSWVHSAPADTL